MGHLCNTNSTICPSACTKYDLDEFASELRAEIQSQVDKELNQVTYGKNAFFEMNRG